MLNKAHQAVGNRRWLLPLVLVIGLAALAMAYRSYQEQRHREAALGAMVVAFKEQNSLNVFQAQVPVFVTNRKDRWVFDDAEQFGVIPASVQYQLDLSDLSTESFRWEPDKRTMTVTLPEPVVSAPVLDLERAQLVTKGLLVPRDVVLELMKKNVATARREAIKEAKNPQMMKLAREAARKAMSHNISVPLQAAGFDDLKVVVRFPTEGTDDPSYLDRSTPYEQAIRERRQRRAAEGKK